MRSVKTNDDQYAKSLIETSLNPLIIVSPDGKIEDANKALAKIVGVPLSSLKGANYYDCFYEPVSVQKAFYEVLQNGSVSDIPLTLLHKNGKHTDILFNASVYKDFNGIIVGVIVVALDIEEQSWATELRVANKKLVFQNIEMEKRAAELNIANKELAFQNKEKEKRAAELIIANKELVFQNREKVKRAAELRIANYARSIIEASLDPLFTINLEGKITDLNTASVNIIGKPRKEIIGTDFFSYFTEPTKASEVYKEVFAKGFVADYPLTIRDGVLTDVLFNGSTYKDDDGALHGAVVVARDITEQKRVEKELIEAKVFAEEATKIAEVAKRKAESATRIAESAVRAKQQFLSNMSHEIRTPMNAIIGFTKVVLKTDLSAKQKEYLQAIKISGDALIVLINDILDLSKVDAGKMSFEQIPFKMSSSISAMLHLFEPKIQEKNLELIKEYDSRIPEVLVGDPVRLHQIILNLVSNAVKFTTRGRITVHISLLKEDEEKVTIEFAVTDTGIGIAEDKIKKIFENFQQASSETSRLFGGTGLGLAIAKQLVEAQKGTIRVKSIIDQGSTFSFTLSFLKTNEPAELDTSDEDLNIEYNDVRVLVAEDIALNQLLMKTLLDDFGFGCDIAVNGRIAIEKLQSGTYDIILMDLQMPEMNGFEATEHIRKQLKSKIPIIALTADVTTVDLAKCKAVGMNDYIAKPVNERLLYSKIVSLVKKPLLATYTNANNNNKSESVKYTDLAYLTLRTKSDPQLLLKMISLYLEQTPPLVSAMQKGFRNNDWESLYSAVHKLIPSFLIVGISADIEDMAKTVQEYARAQVQSQGITELVDKIGEVCTQACIELQQEVAGFKSENE
jgi:PAS domain S-box-containing protein